ncbi:unnamed protein product [Adineta steineri]|uniref:SnoaL-like domain-containing protein n=1 Tax=Adineta steineri TaxID=433720 RepID=A0A815PSG0_9BILA|nr:unnamed protein product [Adineta steineri]
MCQSKEDILLWLKEFHEASASLNAEYFIKKFFDDDAILQFANNSIIKGHENLIKNFQKQFDSLDMMHHEIEHFDILPDRIYQYAKILYKVKGDTEIISIPGLAVFHKTKDEQKIKRFDVFCDPSPLTDKIQMIHSAQ